MCCGWEESEKCLPQEEYRFSLWLNCTQIACCGTMLWLDQIKYIDISGQRDKTSYTQTCSEIEIEYILLFFFYIYKEREWVREARLLDYAFLFVVCIYLF